MVVVVHGSHVKKEPADSGTFFCPGCGHESKYTLMNLVEMKTVYFIPVASMGWVGNLVECNTCGTEFDSSVILANTQLRLRTLSLVPEQVFLLSLQRIMVLMMLADNVVDDQELAVIGDIFRQFTGVQIDKQDLIEDARAAKDLGAGVRDYIATVRDGLTEEGKAVILRAAYHVMMADGTMADEEARLLVQIGEALGFSMERCERIIDELNTRNSTSASSELPTGPQR